MRVLFGGFDDGNLWTESGDTSTSLGSIIVMAAWRSAVAERAPYDLEYRLRRRDGVVMMVFMVFVPRALADRCLEFEASSVRQQQRAGYGITGGRDRRRSVWYQASP